MPKIKVGYYASNVFSPAGLLFGKDASYQYPLRRCPKCGKQMRFDPGSEALANGILLYTGFHYRPAQYVCDNWHCPESPNFYKYLLGEYEPLYIKEVAFKSLRDAIKRGDL